MNWAPYVINKVFLMPMNCLQDNKKPNIFGTLTPETSPQYCHWGLVVRGDKPLKTLVGWGIKCFHELLIFIKMCPTVRKFFNIPMRINWFCCSNFLFLVNLFDFNVPLQSDFWPQRILSQACKSKLFITCLLSWLKHLDFHFLYI